MSLDDVMGLQLASRILCGLFWSNGSILTGEHAYDAASSVVRGKATVAPVADLVRMKLSRLCSLKGQAPYSRYGLCRT